MGELTGQLAVAWRRLVATPGFTVVSILTLGVGIGASTLMFSVVDRVLLRPLPYPDADRLVGVWHTAPGLELEQAPQSVPTYLLYRDGAATLADIALYTERPVNVTGGDEPQRLTAAEVTPSLFRTLGVQPVLGRSFSEEEGRVGAVRVAVLSDRLWRSHFGADRAALDQSVRLDGYPTRIVGVMGDGFAFPSEEVDVWLPLAVDETDRALGRLSLPAVARLDPGASLRSAESNLNGLLADLEARFPESGAAPVLQRAGFAARVWPLRRDLVGDAGGTLWNLLGIAGLVLLIACANVANLLIVRGEARRREVAIESALGAPRSRLVWAVLAECFLLGLAAGVVGVALAFLGLRGLSGVVAGSLPSIDDVTIDTRVLGFTFLLSLLTSLLFGVLPALRATAMRALAVELMGSTRTVSGDRGRARLRQALVSAQVALALVVVIGSGLMIRSSQRLGATDPGFRAEGAVSFLVALPEVEYPSDTASAGFFQNLLERLAAIPGVEAAGATTALPLAGEASARGHAIEGRVLEAGAPPPVFGTQVVSAGYFAAMGIPIRTGRPLGVGDHERRTGAVVVSASLAERVWPGESALDKRLRPAGDEGDWYTVVGVAGDVRNIRLTEEPADIVYYPLLGVEAGAWVEREMSLVLRTTGAPSGVIAPARSVLAELAPSLPMSDVRSLTALVERAGARMRFAVRMFVVAAAIAILLGAVGIYGFISFMVGQRALEIGIRMMIGAGRGEVRGLVLREGLMVGVIGGAIGLVAAAILARLLEAQLFEVGFLDPLTFVVSPAVLLLLVLLASAEPAARAARFEPAVLTRP